MNCTVGSQDPEERHNSMSHEAQPDLFCLGDRTSHSTSEIQDGLLRLETRHHVAAADFIGRDILFCVSFAHLASILSQAAEGWHAYATASSYTWASGLGVQHHDENAVLHDA